MTDKKSLPKNQFGLFKKLGDTLWIHHGGRTFTMNLKGPAAVTKTAKGLQISSGVVLSPMPGKILKVNVAQGDGVTQGQTLCVIEAMKMEYALKAPFGGQIKEILKKTGDSVNLEEKILEVLPAEILKETDPKKVEKR